MHAKQAHTFTDSEADKIMAAADKAFATISRNFHEIQHRYFARQVDDTTFLAARKNWVDAQARWDTLFRLFDNNG